jgi:hypothetical protein
LVDGEPFITAGFSELPDAARTWAALDDFERRWLSSYVRRTLTGYGRHKRRREVLKQLCRGPQAVRAYYGPVDYLGGPWSGGVGMT